MSQAPKFDMEAAHKYFAANCFNQAWDLIEKEDRSPEDDEQMIRLAQASMWHWTQRDDRTDTNLSVGYWQLSRIYALLGRVESARRYGKLSLKLAGDSKPFYQGYAHEALARTEMVAGDLKRMSEHLSKARAHAEQVPDEESRKLLQDDLATIG